MHIWAQGAAAMPSSQADFPVALMAALIKGELEKDASSCQRV